MFKRASTLLLAVLLLFGLSACQGDAPPSQTARQTTAPPTSGRIEAGLRVLTVDPAAPAGQEFTIYRGDYVRLEVPDGAHVTIVIPELQVDKSFPVEAGGKAYFKVPRPGRYAYTIGEASGVIEALPFAATGYKEVSAPEGAALIENVAPFILDVRTPGEFAQGHLSGAQLLPVQVFQQQLSQLADYQDKPVFVYCASGNRSTVASKMLIDHGFTNVTNLNGGIHGWVSAKLPLVK